MKPYSTPTWQRYTHPQAIPIRVTSRDPQPGLYVGPPPPEPSMWSTPYGHVLIAIWLVLFIVAAVYIFGSHIEIGGR